tara:strand:- start:354 stop:623 length:270 start_codon:yes stop_codon:yes gene_type:complete
MRMEPIETVKREIEFSLVDDEDMPPIIITMDRDDNPKVVINRNYDIWLSLHRKTIGGCAEALYGKIDDLLTAHLKDQRMYEKMDRDMGA